MDAVKEYWSNPIFLAGIFLCAIGTILGAFQIVTAGVLVECAGIVLMMISIYSLEKESILNPKNH
ncbi:hypothetical protein [Caminibacter pacificus]